jgi:hypothetical protein
MNDDNTKKATEQDEPSAASVDLGGGPDVGITVAGVSEKSWQSTARSVA